MFDNKMTINVDKIMKLFFFNTEDHEANKPKLTQTN